MSKTNIPLIFITAVALWVATLVGWGINIVKLCDMTFTGHEVELVLRVVGIVVYPLGGIMGLFV